MFSIGKELSNERVLEDYVAFVSTPISLNGPDPPRQSDGFRVGKYEVTVTIMPANGEHLVLKFYVNVTDRWQDLSMRRLVSDQ